MGTGVNYVIDTGLFIVTRILLTTVLWNTTVALLISVSLLPVALMSSTPIKGEEEILYYIICFIEILTL